MTQHYCHGNGVFHADNQIPNLEPIDFGNLNRSKQSIGIPLLEPDQYYHVDSDNNSNDIDHLAPELEKINFGPVSAHVNNNYQGDQVDYSDQINPVHIECGGCDNHGHPHYHDSSWYKKEGKGERSYRGHGHRVYKKGVVYEEKRKKGVLHYKDNQGREAVIYGKSREQTIKIMKMQKGIMKRHFGDLYDEKLIDHCCSWCGKYRQAMITCNKCQSVYYCSGQCADLHRIKGHHKEECDVLIKIKTRKITKKELMVVIKAGAPTFDFMNMKKIPPSQQQAPSSKDNNPSGGGGGGGSYGDAISGINNNNNTNDDDSDEEFDHFDHQFENLSEDATIEAKHKGDLGYDHNLQQIMEKNGVKQPTLDHIHDATQIGYWYGKRYYYRAPYGHARVYYWPYYGARYAGWYPPYYRYYGSYYRRQYRPRRSNYYRKGRNHWDTYGQYQKG